MVDKRGWERLFETLPPLSEEDPLLLPETFIHYIYAMADVLRHNQQLEELNPEEQDNRHRLVLWEEKDFSLFFNHYPDLLTLHVGNQPLEAHEIRPVSITQGELALYNNIILPPGFSLSLNGAYRPQLHGDNIYLCNSNPGIAKQADSKAQEYTGIAVQLEQIRLNRVNGGDIKVSSESPADPQTRAE